MLLAGLVSAPEEGEARMREAIASGAGLRKLKEMIRAQGGNPAVCDDVSLLPQAPYVRTACCGQEGTIQAMDTAALGMAAQAMGAGRLSLEDQLDYSVGYILKVRIGDRVTADTPLCELHAKTEADAARAEAAIRAAIRIGKEPCTRARNFYAVITADGIQHIGENV